MAAAAWSAVQSRSEDRFLPVFLRACDWFHGQNSGNQTMVDRQAGTCFDGLALQGANRNQGAESMLAYLWTELLRQEADSALNRLVPAAQAKP